MKLLRTLAGLCVFALAALPAVAQRGGGSGGGSHGASGGGRSYGGGGASHGSSGGGHSYGGGSSASSGRGSGGSSYSTGSAGRSSGSNGARGYSESYTYPGTGTHEANAGGSAGGFTDHGGIRFSDFGVEETPRFSARMLPPRPATANSSHGYQVVASDQRSEHETWDRMQRGGFDHRDRGFRRFQGYGYEFYGAFGAPYCDLSGSVGYDLSFVQENAAGCYGGESLAENAVDSDAGSDQPAEYEYSSGGDDAIAVPGESAAPGASTEQSNAAPPQVTLLQLKDGSMYGLTAYWVDGGELHYVTNYGGANSIALDRIDLAKTVQLNATHGQAFVLQEKSAPAAAAH